MIEFSSLLAGLVLIVISLIVVGSLVVFVSALKGAGDELGRAALAESSPWIARAIPTLVVRLIFLHADSRVREDLIREILCLVDAEFEQRTATNERVRGIFRVFGQATSLMTEGFSIRLHSLHVDPPRVEGIGPEINEAEIAQRVANMLQILEDHQQGIAELRNIQFPVLPVIKVPELPKIQFPVLPVIKVPELPKIKFPVLPVIKVPELPNIQLPELPRIQLPEMPPLDELEAAAAKIRRVAERFRP